MSRPISWRPSDAAVAALALLEERTGKKRAKLLDDLIIAAARGPSLPDHRVDPGFVKKGSADVARGRLMSVTVDPKKVAGPVTVHGVVSPETQSKIRVAARLGVDPDKVEAFQRKTGMTAFDKRRK